jgi:hypothetical protein
MRHPSLLSSRAFMLHMGRFTILSLSTQKLMYSARKRAISACNHNQKIKVKSSLS